MTAPLVALLLGSAALALWVPFVRGRDAHPWLALFRSGHVFLPIGILGGLGLNPSDATSMTIRSDLWPLIAFATAWAGFVAGLHLDLGHIRRAPPRDWLESLWPGLLAGAAAAGVVLVVGPVGGIPDGAVAPVALILAAGAATSGTRLARAGGARTALSLRAIHASDAIVLTFGLAAFVAVHPDDVALQLVGPFAAGLALAVISWLLLNGASDLGEKLLLSLGTLAIAAGIGTWLELPPPLVAAAFGAFLVILPEHRELRIHDIIVRLERPAIVLLMVAAGLEIAWGASWRMAVGAALIAIIRAVAFAVAARRERPLYEEPGMLGLVVAIAFAHIVAAPFSVDAVGAIALGTMIDRVLVALASPSEALDGADASPHDAAETGDAAPPPGPDDGPSSTGGAS